VLDPVAAFRLDDRVAVVTGASSGLGARFARVLHAAGASVVLAARRMDRLEALAADLPGSLPVRCDVSVEEDLVGLVDAAIARRGAIDVLVNNAGVGDPVRAEDETLEQIRRTIDVDLVAVYRLCQLAGVGMLARGRGSIVNVSSVLGLTGVGQIPQASYVAAKHGLVGLTKDLAAQWARRGVRVNALCPGWFPSEMTDGRMVGDEDSERWIRRKVPMGRFGVDHELDGALLFLASDASTFVTGIALAVDGGYTAV
jgi:NAD(P)-dependent dehydrogenase (short-subunit alcohol dehydrogenase family)